MPAIHAVTIDLWQTLVIDDRDRGRERARLRILGAVDALRDASHDFTEDHVREAYRACYRACHAVRQEGRDLSFDDQVRIFVRNIGDGLLERLPPATFQRIVARYADAFFDAPPVMAEGVQETLAALKAHGYKLGIISNTGMTPGRLFRDYFQAQGILGYFDHLAFSDEVLLAKPSPGIFLGALEGLACPVANAVHVGDHLRNDIQGAQALGIRTVWLEGFDTSQSDAKPTATIQRITQLPEALAKLEGE